MNRELIVLETMEGVQSRPMSTEAGQPYLDMHCRPPASMMARAFKGEVNFADLINKKARFYRTDEVLPVPTQTGTFTAVIYRQKELPK